VKTSLYHSLTVLTTVAMMTCCMMTTNAQPTATVSTTPQVKPDGSVAFALRAPGADSVQLVLDTQPTTAMTRDNTGVWRVTSEPLPDGLYRYAFKVDGLMTLDNANAHTARDVASVMNVLLVDREGKSPLAVRDVPHGTVSAVWYESPTLHCKRRMMIYTPPGYDATRRRYPVLYLLHGSGGDETSWLELGRVAQVMDNLLATGQAMPMLVVMPNGNVDEQATPGMAPAGMVQPTLQHTHTMDGKFEKSFDDIVQWIDSHYRTQTGKRHRAIAGLSMGGYHALYISANQPDDFGYVGLFSAAVKRMDKNHSRIYNDLESKLRLQFQSRPRLYWIGIGKEDFLYQDNVRLRELLDRNGLRYTYHESEGGHEWRNWRDYLMTFVPLLFH